MWRRIYLVSRFNKTPLSSTKPNAIFFDNGWLFVLSFLLLTAPPLLIQKIPVSISPEFMYSLPRILLLQVTPRILVLITKKILFYAFLCLLWIGSNIISQSQVFLLVVQIVVLVVCDPFLCYWLKFLVSMVKTRRILCSWLLSLERNWLHSWIRMRNW